MQHVPHIKVAHCEFKHDNTMFVHIYTSSEPNYKSFLQISLRTTYIYLGMEGVYIWVTSGRGCVLTLSCVFFSFISKMLVLCKIANKTNETTVCDCTPSIHECATLTMCDARTQQNRPCLVVPTASVNQCKGVMCTLQTQTRQRPIKDLVAGG